LMNGMTYRESNNVYDATYSAPVDFPITELFGNAYGSVAAHQKLEGDSDKRRLVLSRFSGNWTIPGFSKRLPSVVAAVQLCVF